MPGGVVVDERQSLLAAQGGASAYAPTVHWYTWHSTLVAAATAQFAAKALTSTIFNVWWNALVEDPKRLAALTEQHYKNKDRKTSFKSGSTDDVITHEQKSGILLEAHLQSPGIPEKFYAHLEQDSHYLETLCKSGRVVPKEAKAKPAEDDYHGKMRALLSEILSDKTQLFGSKGMRGFIDHCPKFMKHLSDADWQQLANNHQNLWVELMKRPKLVAQLRQFKSGNSNFLYQIYTICDPDSKALSQYIADRYYSHSVKENQVWENILKDIPADELLRLAKDTSKDKDDLELRAARVGMAKALFKKPSLLRGLSDKDRDDMLIQVFDARYTNLELGYFACKRFKPTIYIWNDKHDKNKKKVQSFHQDSLGIQAGKTLEKLMNADVNVGLAEYTNAHKVAAIYGESQFAENSDEYQAALSQAQENVDFAFAGSPHSIGRKNQKVGTDFVRQFNKDDMQGAFANLRYDGAEERIHCLATYHETQLLQSQLLEQAADHFAHNNESYLKQQQSDKGVYPQSKPEVTLTLEEIDAELEILNDDAAVERKIKAALDAKATELELEESDLDEDNKQEITAAVEQSIADRKSELEGKKAKLVSQQDEAETVTVSEANPKEESTPAPNEQHERAIKQVNANLLNGKRSHLLAKMLVKHPRITRALHEKHPGVVRNLFNLRAHTTGHNKDENDKLVDYSIELAKANALTDNGLVKTTRIMSDVLDTNKFTKWWKKLSNKVSRAVSVVSHAAKNWVGKLASKSTENLGTYPGKDADAKALLTAHNAAGKLQSFRAAGDAYNPHDLFNLLADNKLSLSAAKNLVSNGAMYYRLQRFYLEGRHLREESGDQYYPNGHSAIPEALFDRRNHIVAKEKEGLTVSAKNALQTHYKALLAQNPYCYAAFCDERLNSDTRIVRRINGVQDDTPKIDELRKVLVELITEGCPSFFEFHGHNLDALFESDKELFRDVLKADIDPDHRIRIEKLSSVYLNHVVSAKGLTDEAIESYGLGFREQEADGAIDNDTLLTLVKADLTKARYEGLFELVVKYPLFANRLEMLAPELGKQLLGGANGLRFAEIFNYVVAQRQTEDDVWSDIKQKLNKEDTDRQDYVSMIKARFNSLDATCQTMYQLIKVMLVANAGKFVKEIVDNSTLFEAMQQHAPEMLREFFMALPKDTLTPEQLEKFENLGYDEANDVTAAQADQQPSLYFDLLIKKLAPESRKQLQNFKPETSEPGREFVLNHAEALCQLYARERDISDEVYDTFEQKGLVTHKAIPYLSQSNLSQALGKITSVELDANVAPQKRAAFEQLHILSAAANARKLKISLDDPADVARKFTAQLNAQAVFDKHKDWLDAFTAANAAFNFPETGRRGSIGLNESGSPEFYNALTVRGLGNLLDCYADAEQQTKILLAVHEHNVQLIEDYVARVEAEFEKHARVHESTLYQLLDGKEHLGKASNYANSVIARMARLLNFGAVTTDKGAPIKFKVAMKFYDSISAEKLLFLLHPHAHGPSLAERVHAYQEINDGTAPCITVLNRAAKVNQQAVGDFVETVLVKMQDERNKPDDFLTIVDAFTQHRGIVNNHGQFTEQPLAKIFVQYLTPERVTTIIEAYGKFYQDEAQREAHLTDLSKIICRYRPELMCEMLDQYSHAVAKPGKVKAKSEYQDESAYKKSESAYKLAELRYEEDLQNANGDENRVASAEKLFAKAQEKFDVAKEGYQAGGEAYQQAVEKFERENTPYQQAVAKDKAFVAKHLKYFFTPLLVKEKEISGRSSPVMFAVQSEGVITDQSYAFGHPAMTGHRAAMFFDAEGKLLPCADGFGEMCMRYPDVFRQLVDNDGFRFVKKAEVVEEKVAVAVSKDETPEQKKQRLSLTKTQHEDQLGKIKQALYQANKATYDQYYSLKKCVESAENIQSTIGGAKLHTSDEGFDAAAMVKELWQTIVDSDKVVSAEDAAKYLGQKISSAANKQTLLQQFTKVMVAELKEWPRLQQAISEVENSKEKETRALERKIATLDRQISRLDSTKTQARNAIGSFLDEKAKEQGGLAPVRRVVTKSDGVYTNLILENLAVFNVDRMPAKIAATILLELPNLTKLIRDAKQQDPQAAVQKQLFEKCAALCQNKSQEAREATLELLQLQRVGNSFIREKLFDAVVNMLDDEAFCANIADASVLVKLLSVGTDFAKPPALRTDKDPSLNLLITEMLVKLPHLMTQVMASTDETVADNLFTLLSHKDNKVRFSTIFGFGKGAENKSHHEENLDTEMLLRLLASDREKSPYTYTGHIFSSREFGLRLLQTQSQEFISFYQLQFSDWFKQYASELQDLEAEYLQKLLSIESLGFVETKEGEQANRRFFGSVLAGDRKDEITMNELRGLVKKFSDTQPILYNRAKLKDIEAVFYKNPAMMVTAISAASVKKYESQYLDAIDSVKVKVKQENSDVPPHPEDVKRKDGENDMLFNIRLNGAKRAYEQYQESLKENPGGTPKKEVTKEDAGSVDLSSQFRNQLMQRPERLHALIFHGTEKVVKELFAQPDVMLHILSMPMDVEPWANSSDALFDKLREHSDVVANLFRNEQPKVGVVFREGFAQVHFDRLMEVGDQVIGASLAKLGVEKPELANAWLHSQVSNITSTTVVTTQNKRRDEAKRQLRSNAPAFVTYLESQNVGDLLQHNQAEAQQLFELLIGSHHAYIAKWLAPLYSHDSCHALVQKYYPDDFRNGKFTVEAADVVLADWEMFAGYLETRFAKGSEQLTAGELSALLQASEVADRGVAVKTWFTAVVLNDEDFYPVACNGLLKLPNAQQLIANNWKFFEARFEILFKNDVGQVMLERLLGGSAEQRTFVVRQCKNNEQFNGVVLQYFASPECTPEIIQENPELFNAMLEDPKLLTKPGALKAEALAKLFGQDGKVLAGINPENLIARVEDDHDHLLQLLNVDVVTSACIAENLGMIYQVDTIGADDTLLHAIHHAGTLVDKFINSTNVLCKIMAIENVDVRKAMLSQPKVFARWLNVFNVDQVRAGFLKPFYADIMDLFTDVDKALAFGRAYADSFQVKPGQKQLAVGNAPVAETVGMEIVSCDFMLNSEQKAASPFHALCEILATEIAEKTNGFTDHFKGDLSRSFVINDIPIDEQRYYQSLLKYFVNPQTREWFLGDIDKDTLLIVAAMGGEDAVKVLFDQYADHKFFKGNSKNLQRAAQSNEVFRNMVMVKAVECPDVYRQVFLREKTQEQKNQLLGLGTVNSWLRDESKWQALLQFRSEADFNLDAIIKDMPVNERLALLSCEGVHGYILADEQLKQHFLPSEGEEVTAEDGARLEALLNHDCQEVVSAFAFNYDQAKFSNLFATSELTRWLLKPNVAKYVLENSAWQKTFNMQREDVWDMVTEIEPEQWEKILGANMADGPVVQTLREAFGAAIDDNKISVIVDMMTNPVVCKVLTPNILRFAINRVAGSSHEQRMIEAINPEDILADFSAIDTEDFSGELKEWIDKGLAKQQSESVSADGMLTPQKQIVRADRSQGTPRSPFADVLNRLRISPVNTP